MSLECAPTAGSDRARTGRPEASRTAGSRCPRGFGEVSADELVAFEVELMATH
jgi:hypothetical protein